VEKRYENGLYQHQHVLCLSLEQTSEALTHQLATVVVLIYNVNVNETSVHVQLFHQLLQPGNTETSTQLS